MAVASLLCRRVLSSPHAVSSCRNGSWHPHMWYPKAREKKRNVYLHVSPTNSGKTYNALKRLEASSSGVYCGPLRLLAREVAQRLNKINVPCNLITGQERDEIEGAKHTSVTVEMADVTTEYHCAVIDEIQMVGCKSRGFSFTRALLGLCSDELHVCGDPAAVPLIQRILEATGDLVTVQYYERLSPLVPLKFPLGSFSNIKAGDCLVTFSRREIYTLKKRIEMEGKHLCSVVYGSLPPETRTKQAGRYGSKFPVGEVTCLDAEDLPLLHSSLKSPSPIIEERFLEKAKLSPDYFIAECEDMLKVAAIVDDLPLGLYDKYLFCIRKGIVRLKEIFTPGTLQVPKTHNQLKELESVHKVLELYVWLSFRVEDSFPDREVAASQKSICSMLIEEYLERSGWQPQGRRKLLRGPQKLLRKYDASQMYDIFNLQKCLVSFSIMSGMTATGIF
ncbi:ATP-dependent RNA helicase SUV3, mitochondrial [Panicum miliaceum]|uniref:RNA helicase n=1 Tax=Panicum miliaceum TaxID=4540 RepID=A0A3L6TP26_PANMI|nr:ATP-dependent RNA helicase SUV3, mitochondrial [Panicum miliaceum]